MDLTAGTLDQPSYGDELVVTTQASAADVIGSRTPPHSGLGGMIPKSDSALGHEPRGFFADQFENESNFQAHYHGTGPEILRQTSGNVDAFVSGAGELIHGWWESPH